MGSIGKCTLFLSFQGVSLNRERLGTKLKLQSPKRQGDVTEKLGNGMVFLASTKIFSEEMNLKSIKILQILINRYLSRYFCQIK